MDRPALALTRQKVAVIDRTRFNSAAGLRRGGYILAEAEGAETPQLILIATGSEVSLALEAREKLQAEGVATRVVSLALLGAFRRTIARISQRSPA
jgi:transketolase